MTEDTRAIPDESLLERIQADFGGASGRRAASELFARHSRRVYLWCRRYVHDHERAMELAQDVMLNAYRAIPRFEGRSQFSSWLFAIARNHCLKQLRSPGLLHDPEADPDQVADPAGGPGDRWEEYLEEQRLRTLLETHLDDDERRALWLRCFEKMPVDEIGRVMQLENATGARALLQRARRRLRAALERGGEAS